MLWDYLTDLMSICDHLILGGPHPSCEGLHSEAKKKGVCVRTVTLKFFPSLTSSLQGLLSRCQLCHPRLCGPNSQQLCFLLSSPSLPFPSPPSPFSPYSSLAPDNIDWSTPLLALFLLHCRVWKIPLSWKVVVKSPRTHQSAPWRKLEMVCVFLQPKLLKYILPCRYPSRCWTGLGFQEANSEIRTYI